MGNDRKKLQTEVQLRDLLRQPSFNPGDRLPGERELAEAVGVGRTALRLILEKLVAEGVLERRPQSGTYLRRRPVQAFRAGEIAVIAPIGCPGAQMLWMHHVISAIERTLAPSGLKPLILDQSPLAPDPCSVKLLACKAAEAGVAAAILIHPLGSREKIACALGLLHNAGVHPVVVSPRRYSGLSSDVYFDSEWGAYMATRHLMEHGHRAIGFAGAAAGHEWVQDRLRGYRQALSTLEIEPRPEWEWIGGPGEISFSGEDGAQAARALLAQPLTAVVAVNDVVALGFWNACRSAGIDVPERLSLIGFDNDSESLLTGLTTLERPSAALGEAAARTALDRVAAGRSADSLTVRLQPVLIERRTVKPLDSSTDALWLKD